MAVQAALRSTSSAYLLLMATLLFGLPLLIGYYSFDYGYMTHVLVPYLVVSAAVILFLVVNSTKGVFQKNVDQTAALQTDHDNENIDGSFNVIGRLSRVPTLAILVLAASTLILFGTMSFVAISSYPFPPPLNVMTALGLVYIIMLIGTSIVAFPRILCWAFPVLNQIFGKRKYDVIAIVFASLFALVYLLLVNQVIIAGYNVELTVPASLLGKNYPNALAMTPAVVNQPLLDIVYLPTVLVQVSPQMNLILIPFEMAFVTLLSLLVASNVTMAYYLISEKNGLKCTTKGAALSTGGSLLGLTATCPTCLAPTIVSVIFGGVSTTSTIFSNFNGVVLPPVLSVAVLLLSAAYLSREIKRRHGQA